MFLLHPSHPFHQPFSTPHLIIIFYSHFPSSSSFFSFFPPVAKPSTCADWTYLIERRIYYTCVYMFYFMLYIKYTYMSYHIYVLLHFHVVLMCSAIILCKLKKVTFLSNLCDYVLGINSAHPSPFSIISPTFPLWNNPLCSLLLGEMGRERRVCRSWLSLKGKCQPFRNVFYSWAAEGISVSGLLWS